MKDRENSELIINTANQDGTEESDLFVFDKDQRAAILASINLAEGELADRLILLCEMAADSAFIDWDIYDSLPNVKSAKWRIDGICWHLDQAIELASFGNDVEARGKFWAVVLGDKNRVLLDSTRTRFVNAYNTIVLIGRYLAKLKIDGKLTRKRYSIDVLRECVCGNDILKLLAVIYVHVLNRKCGRSKSTIGPFVRFAHSVMYSIAGDLTPPIETINERWARLSFEPTGKRLLKDCVDAYCAKRGVRSPL
ncbi:hypothetical protein OGR47_11465 [Methylocystis sp. MJC1]|uniref:hypothetical protein n=1 Tax=Methylocystis sp. MJC1 TaxID=2654282 RepID=UPI0013EDC839|nr:hypothetical protein [Methylocystis sp. MJC1]KAF2990149.1 hypothetical protein MJC1_02809 [Methylocystis sp. MJC1]MBU6527600.1 hypothetical protein [Methylocystis sp. MJC1]UZX10539.1 hypothetical protein OGR47_11465 [Methylocystis sp. MJC1]